MKRNSKSPRWLLWIKYDLESLSEASPLGWSPTEPNESDFAEIENQDHLNWCKPQTIIISLVNLSYTRTCQKAQWRAQMESATASIDPCFAYIFATFKTVLEKLMLQNMNSMTSLGAQAENPAH